MTPDALRRLDPLIPCAGCGRLGIVERCSECREPACPDCGAEVETWGDCCDRCFAMYEDADERMEREADRRG